MDSPPDTLPLGIGFIHREIVDPLSREMVPCVLTHQQADDCFIRPLVMTAPLWRDPVSVFHQPGGHGEYWNAWRLSSKRLRRGLVELRDVRGNLFAADEIPVLTRVPGVGAQPRRGLRFLHRALLVPYSWRPLPGHITQVRAGNVSFVGLVEFLGQEHRVAPYGGRNRSGRWQMPEEAFHEGLIAPIG